MVIDIPYMPCSVLLRHLEDLAEKLGLKIRYEDLKDEEVTIEGGLCRLEDTHLILLDKRREDLYNAKILARILRRFDLHDIYLLPGLREFIEKEDVH